MYMAYTTCALRRIALHSPPHGPCAPATNTFAPSPSCAHRCKLRSPLLPLTVVPCGSAGAGAAGATRTGSCVCMLRASVSAISTGLRGSPDGIPLSRRRPSPPCALGGESWVPRPEVARARRENELPSRCKPGENALLLVQGCIASLACAVPRPWQPWVTLGLSLASGLAWCNVAHLALAALC